VSDDVRLVGQAWRCEVVGDSKVVSLVVSCVRVVCVCVCVKMNVNVEVLVVWVLGGGCGSKISSISILEASTNEAWNEQTKEREGL